MRRVISLLIVISFLSIVVFMTACSVKWCTQAHNYALATAEVLGNRWECDLKQKMAHDLIYILDKTVCHEHPIAPNDIKIGANLICSAAVNFLAILDAYVIADRYICNFMSVFKDISQVSVLCNLLILLKTDSIEQAYMDVVNGKIKWESKPTKIDYTPAWQLSCITADCQDVEVIINRK